MPNINKVLQTVLYTIYYIYTLRERDLSQPLQLLSHLFPIRSHFTLQWDNNSYLGHTWGSMMRFSVSHHSSQRQGWEKLSCLITCSGRKDGKYILPESEKGIKVLSQLTTWERASLDGTDMSSSQSWSWDKKDWLRPWWDWNWDHFPLGKFNLMGFFPRYLRH